jgi:flagellar assembly protein FliH
MNASLDIRPFAFDRIFAVAGPPGPAVRTEDLQLRIAALEAETQRMRDDQDAMLALARADGFEAGVIQARTEREAAYLAAVDALQASLEMMDSRFDGVMAQMQQDAAEVALSAAEVLAARALTEAPVAAIDEAIGRVLKQVARGQELLVRVHPALVGEVQHLVAERQAGDRRRLNLQVAGDVGLAQGDAHIEWDQGGLVLDASLRAEAIRSELSALLPVA